MQYSNFDMRNNVHATLSTAISSVATTIQLTAWQWSRFWTTFPQIATIESFDENWKVMKREIVKITARNGDNLTVVRAFAPCPENDDANSQSQTAISFNADDTISLYIPKEIFDIIKKSLNDIYDNGANNMRTEVVSWLQVEVNPWQVLVWSAYYDFAGWTITLTDNATNYLEVDEDGNLVNNTTARNDQNTKLAIITTSGGSVTHIKDRRLWTIGWKIGGVNIHELTEKTYLSKNDEFIFADSDNIYNNKKVKYSTLSKQVLYVTAWENLVKWNIVYITNGQAFKVNISNQWIIPFQCFVVMNDTDANDPVALIYGWIADWFSWLTIWKKYFVSSILWEITDQQNWWFMVWVAISNTEILLKNEYFVIKDGTDVLIEDTTEHYAQSTTAIEIFSQTMDFDWEISLSIQYKRTNWYNDSIEIIWYINWTQIFSYLQLPNNYDYLYYTKSAIAINNWDIFTITARRTWNYWQRYLIDDIKILWEYNILYK